MSESTRTFVAIPIPESIGKRLSRLQVELTPEVPGCRWTASSPFHLTLAFLGDVRNSDLNELCLAVAAATEAFERFDVNLQGLGAFPSPRKPRVVWSGVTAPNPNLINDARSTRPGGDASGLSARRVQVSSPHHLGRIKLDREARCDLTELVRRRTGLVGGSFTVVEVVTFASTAAMRGATYAALGRARLLGKKIESSH